MRSQHDLNCRYPSRSKAREEDLPTFQRKTSRTSKARSVGQRELNGLLRDWGDALIREIESCSLNSETITYKLMRCGVMVQSGTIPIPNYWPRSDLVKINNAVWSLQTKHRNYFVLRYALGVDSKPQIAEACHVSRGTIYNWWNGGEPYKTLLNHLND